jgi:UDP-glucuronate 4-epimerase
MRGTKVLITGVTGQLATPIARALAVDNEVWGIARFTNNSSRQALERAGVRCLAVNLAAGDFEELPTDFDYVLNLAVAKSGNWDIDLRANAESVGLLMAHCRSAKAFLHCSSTAVYDPPDDEPRTERAALGDNHKPMFPTYSISKIAAEVVARSTARILSLPTTIARLNLPYGDNGGWPYFHMEMMLAGMPIPVPSGGPAAAVPAVTVNWAGGQTVSLQEWCIYLGSLIARQPVFEVSGQALRGVPTDVTRMHEIVGNTSVDWRDGMRRMAATFHPELVSDRNSAP